MYTDPAPLLLSAVLLGLVAAALLASKVSTSLIVLFYASIVLGAIFTIQGDSLIGLFEMITFAGGVSVLLLSAVLMTGQSELRVGAGGAKLALLVAVVVAAALASATFLGGIQSSAPQAAPPPPALLSFIWVYRPWDLLILVTVFVASLVVAANLFSKEQG